MKFVMKGGVWKNTEDEILKAAVMKYGVNQWSRISSLLVRKSAKQCKARWYEWLDPSIKKTDWSRQEEEKLLHLAKIMPTQWRTIAPMIGRTAAQCLEHYERLLDAAQKHNVGEEIDEEDDPRRLRPGEIDPFPETRPARPDPIDMDEDEKEMLNEARARLANTKGKKAKRKAREKALLQARRLASLQKHRELRAAGIETQHQRRMRRREVINYNREIPFHKRAPKGFFDTSTENENARELLKDKTFKAVDLTDLEGERRDAVEARERKKDSKRQRVMRKSNLPASLEAIEKMNNPTFVGHRPKLSMPTPQVSNAELEELARLNAKGVVPAEATGGSGAQFVSGTDYGMTPGMTPGAALGKTAMRTPAPQDTIMQEAENQLRLQSTKTPLLGGANPDLHQSDFSGITPRPSAVKTPSALQTPGRGGQTPMLRPATGSETPFRDQMGINEDFEYNPKRERKRLKMTRSQLKTGLKGLPQPQNEYEIMMPDLPKDADDDEEYIEPDAEDVLAQRQQAKDAAFEEEMLRRSQALQRELPRPVVVNTSDLPLDGTAPLARAQELIQDELVAMLRFDSKKYPIVDPDSKKRKRPRNPIREEFTDSELHEADDLIRKALEDLRNEQGLLPEGPSQEEVEEFTKSSERVLQESRYIPHNRSYGIFSELSKKERLSVFQQEFDVLRGLIAEREKKANKLEKKMKIFTGGYAGRASSFHQEMAKIAENLSESDQQLTIFFELYRHEKNAVPKRQSELKSLVDEQSANEKTLQLRYKELTDKVGDLEALLK